MVKKYIPNRGDIVFLDFDPIKGHEQGGNRPALVLSPYAYNSATELLIACPITSVMKGYPFEVAIPTYKKIKGVILSNYVRSIDWKERRVKFIEKISPELLQEVTAKLGTLLLED